MSSLADELAANGVLTKKRIFRDGRTVGGIPFTTGPLAALLKNPVYIGKVRQSGDLYDGEHARVIDQDLWEKVQATLAANRHERRLGSRAHYPSLLTGMITDPDGRAMSPTFASRGAQRHHYYVSRLQPGESRKSIWRVPAREIDRVVLAVLGKRLEEDAGFSDNVEKSAAALADLPVPEQRAILLQRQAAIRLHSNQLCITISESEGAEATLELLDVIVRRGAEVRIVETPGGGSNHAPDPILLKLVVLARVAQQAQLAGREEPMVSHYSKAHLQQLLRISWLAPDILSAIADGSQPVALTGRRLLRATNIPLAWADQRRLFGFA